MLETRLPIALLVLRLTLGIFLLQWGVEKFVVPGTTLAIFRNFYGFDPGAFVPPVLGVFQVALALALLVGFQPRITYGVALILHSVTTLVTIPRLLAPWNPVSNHLFIAGVPVLAAFFALYLLRDWDRWRIGGATREAP
jgi:uncharacterized membrane protein YphA (DoxX/SURF4 family)